MGLLGVLFLTILLLWFFVIIISRDVFSPSAIICESYLIAIACSLYNYEKWGMDFHLNTFFTILIGIIIFVFVSAIYNTTRKKEKTVEKREISLIKFERTNIVAILLIISFVIAIIYFIYFFQALNSISASSFSEKMEIYRHRTTRSGIVYIPTIVNFLIKFCRALAIIYTYIIINNVMYYKINNIKMKDSNLFFYIVGILIYIPISASSGARFDLIIYILSCIMVWYILYNRHSIKKMNFQKLVKLGIIFVLIIIIFGETKNIFGRNNNSNEMLDYFTQYFGGSIHCFDVYLQKERESCEVFGQELFSGIRKFLYQLRILPENKISKDIGEFVYMNNGEAIGNIYSAFRNMHHDFGYIGIIIFQMLLAIIFNKFYNYILKYRTNEKNNYIDYSVLVYSSSVFCLFLHSYSEYFFCTILSFNYVMLFAFMSVILTMLKVKVRKK